MYTFDGMPWISYLEYDQVTGQKELKKNTPSHIRKQYEEYQILLKRCQTKNQNN